MSSKQNVAVNARRKDFYFENNHHYSWADAKQGADENLVYNFKNFFTQQQVKNIVSAFYNARSDWSEGFKGQQYSLGEVWYHYAETNEGVETYREQAVNSRDIFEKHIPGLHAHILNFLCDTLNTSSVSIRDGWAGPGIVSFLSQNYVAKNGGGLHYDIEGLSVEEMTDPAFELYSFVSMLQKPDSGACLYTWDKRYDHNDAKDRENSPMMSSVAGKKRAYINYQLCDLWMFKGLNAHHIEKFTGDLDRICLTFHIAKRNDHWDVWF